MGQDKFRNRWLTTIEELKKKYAESGSEEDKALLEKCLSDFRGNVRSDNLSLKYSERPRVTRENQDFVINPRYSEISE